MVKKPNVGILASKSIVHLLLCTMGNLLKYLAECTSWCVVPFYSVFFVSCVSAYHEVFTIYIVASVSSKNQVLAP